MASKNKRKSYLRSSVDELFGDGLHGSKSQRELTSESVVAHSLEVLLKGIEANVVDRPAAVQLALEGVTNSVLDSSQPRLAGRLASSSRSCLVGPPLTDCERGAHQG